MKKGLELFFDMEKLKGALVLSDLTWDKHTMTDEIVKVKKSDLEALIQANNEAYNLLDNISTNADEVIEGIKSALHKLEESPSELDEIIVEDEDEGDETSAN